MKNKVGKGCLITIMVIFGLTMVALLVAKNAVENKLANEAEPLLRDFLRDFERETDNTVNVSFDDVSVNSFSPSVSLSNVSVEYDDGYDDGKLFLENFTIGSSYSFLFSELMRVIEDQSIEDVVLSSLFLEFDNVNIEASIPNGRSRRTQKIKFDLLQNLEINFNGEIDASTLEYFFEDGTLPLEDQVLKIDIVGFQSQEYMRFLEEIDDLGFSLSSPIPSSDMGFVFKFMPSVNQIVVEDLYIKDEFGLSDWSLKIDYIGDQLELFSPSFRYDRGYNDYFDIVAIDMQGSSKWSYNNWKVNVEDEADMTFNKISSNFRFSVDSFGQGEGLFDMDEEDFLQNMILDYSMAIEDFQLKLSNKIIREIRYEMPSFPSLKKRTLYVDNLTAEMKLDENEFLGSIAAQTTLCSFDGDFDFYFDLDDNRGPEINKLKLKIDDMLSDEFFEEFLDGLFGRGTFKKVLRRRGILLIDLSGHLGEPQLKLKNGKTEPLW